ncbi:hypothetical protein EG834_05845 [bacterium]|nr:hypothetical protein [bacterium]
MIRLSPLHMILIGALLLVLGVVLPLLMVIKIIPSTLGLSFLSYTASVVGMFVGLIGALTYARSKKRG